MVQRGGTGALGAKNSDTTSWHELFSLIAPVHPKLLSVLYINKMIRNAPEHYETHQNLSLGSNGVDQVRSLQKCPMRLRGPNFCVNCNIRPVLHCVLCSYEMITNAPKQYETQKTWVLGPLGWTGCVHFEKFHRNFMVQTFALTAPV